MIQADAQNDNTVLKRWLADPDHDDHAGKVTRRWLGRPGIVASWAGLLLALFTPPQGTGFTVCWLKAGTGLPCPGCGLTRSPSCGLRGMFAESWHYHPMGLLILGFFVAVAAASLVPGLRNYFTAFIESRSRLFTLVYVGFVVAFVGFGLVRALVMFATQTAS